MSMPVQKSQVHKTATRSQDDDKRLCLVDDLKEVQVHIQVKPMYAEFLEKNLISQEVSRRAVEFKEIQNEDTSPSENTSKILVEVEGFEPPQEEVIHVRRSVRVHRAPKRLCLNVEVQEHSLGDLNEPTNYKAAMLDPESDKWLDAMNTKMQSMKDNQV
ncbi:hypothetical protein Tco_0650913 [Tanacetum coccineum]